MHEEYLLIPELSDRIKIARQTIYNMISNGDFVLNKHYFKPMPKKVLFIWSAVESWLRGEGDNGSTGGDSPRPPIKPKAEISTNHKAEQELKSYINI